MMVNVFKNENNSFLFSQFVNAFKLYLEKIGVFLKVFKFSVIFIFVYSAKILSLSEVYSLVCKQKMYMFETTD